MVTFCLGSARQKRAYFLQRNVTFLDNGEVLFCASENGRNFFAYGSVPYASFSVDGYLSYMRGDAEIAARLGLRGKKLLGSLCSAQLRALDYAVRGAPCDRAVAVNLDGAKYSRRNRKALAALVELCPNAYVCVSDERFVKKYKGEYKTMRFGESKKAKVRFYAARMLAGRLGAYRISVM